MTFRDISTTYSGLLSRVKNATASCSQFVLMLGRYTQFEMEVSYEL